MRRLIGMTLAIALLFTGVACFGGKKHTVDDKEAVPADHNGGQPSTEELYLYIADPGAYHLAGTYTSGQVVVEVESNEEVRLILDGATISNASAPVIDCKQAGTLTIELAGTSGNSFDDAAIGGAEAISGQPAVIFANSDLVFVGDGKLEISSSMGDCINTAGAVEIVSGTYLLEAVNNGIQSQKSVEIHGGELTIVADNNGIHVNSYDSGHSQHVRMDAGQALLSTFAEGIVVNGDISLTGGRLVVHGPELPDAPPLYALGELEISGIDYFATCNMDSADMVGIEQLMIELVFTEPQSPGSSLRFNWDERETIELLPLRPYRLFIGSTAWLEAGEHGSVQVGSNDPLEAEPRQS